jgi:hypothetical protein
VRVLGVAVLMLGMGMLHRLVFLETGRWVPCSVGVGCAST